MSEDAVFDFRIAKLQRYIRRCHAEGRPVPAAYAAIEHNLDPAHNPGMADRTGRRN